MTVKPNRILTLMLHRLLSCAPSLLAFSLAVCICIRFAVPASFHGDTYLINDTQNVLRLHVIANSDSKADQSIKLAVRDAVLEYGQGLFLTGENSPATIEETKEILMQNGAGLMDSVEDVLYGLDADYKASLRMGEYEFPDRVYGDTLYPEGDYQALRVVLGDGAGKNWWCVMFPPLCILEEDTGQSEAESAPPQSTEEDSVTIELKSLLAEFLDWLGSLFSGGQNDKT